MAVQAIVDEQPGTVLQRSHVVGPVGRLVPDNATFRGLCAGRQAEGGNQGKNNLFHRCYLQLSVRVKNGSIWRRLGHPLTAPPRHQKEEPKIEQRAQLGYTLTD